MTNRTLLNSTQLGGDSIQLTFNSLSISLFLFLLSRDGPRVSKPPPALSDAPPIRIPNRDCVKVRVSPLAYRMMGSSHTSNLHTLSPCLRQLPSRHVFRRRGGLQLHRLPISLFSFLRLSITRSAKWKDEFAGGALAGTPSANLQHALCRVTMMAQTPWDEKRELASRKDKSGGRRNCTPKYERVLSVKSKPNKRRFISINLSTLARGDLRA